MKWALWSLIAGFFGVVGISAAETPAPTREYLETKGWSIGFAPEDRAVAEGIAAEIEGFDRRLAEIVAVRSEFGPDDLKKRAGELGKKAAAINALPGKADDFKKEFDRAAEAAAEIDTALHETLFLHKIEIWRTAEVRRRVGAGEKIPGFEWDPVERRPNVTLKFNWEISPVDFKVTNMIQGLPAVFLRLEDQGDAKEQFAGAKKGLDDWANISRQMLGSARPLAISAALQVAIRRVLKAECADEPASAWVREGLVAWTTRELVLQSVPAKNAGKYLEVIARLPVPKAGDKPIDLEAIPENAGREYAMMARQVFLNIAEVDGAPALQQLLESFWKLPVEQRTSANLRRLYREQTKTDLERRAPLRSLRAK